MENVSFATTYSSTAPATEQRSALLAGQLYAKAGVARPRGGGLQQGRLPQAGGRDAGAARPAGEGGGALPARRGERSRRRRVRGGRRRGARGDAEGRGRVQGRQAGRGGGVLPQGPGLPARGRAVRVGGDDGRGRRGLRGRRELGARRRRLHARRARGARRGRVREGGRVRDGGDPVREARRPAARGRPVRPRRPHVQERRGRRARGRSRAGDRLPAARAGLRRQPPRGDGAARAALHRDAAAPPSPASAC